MKGSNRQCSKQRRLRLATQLLSASPERVFDFVTVFVTHTCSPSYLTSRRKYVEGPGLYSKTLSLSSVGYNVLGMNRPACYFWRCQICVSKLGPGVHQLDASLTRLYVLISFSQKPPLSVEILQLHHPWGQTTNSRGTYGFQLRHSFKLLFQYILDRLHIMVRDPLDFLHHVSILLAPVFSHRVQQLVGFFTECRHLLDCRVGREGLQPSDLSPEQKVL
jgi:hypothetical protein